MKLLEKELKNLLRKHPALVEVLVHAQKLREFRLPDLAKSCGGVKTPIIRRYIRPFMKMNIIYRKEEGVYCFNDLFDSVISNILNQLNIILHTEKFLLMEDKRYYILLINRRKGIYVKRLDKKVIEAIQRNSQILPREFSLKDLYTKLNMPKPLASLALKIMCLINIIEKKKVNNRIVYSFK